MVRKPRPPGGGKGGIRLRTPTRGLRGRSHTRSVASGPRRAKPILAVSASLIEMAVPIEAATRNPSPRRKLVRGPTTAVKNSALGEGGSRSMFETPPKRKSVMLLTGTPKRCATTECASSCKRMDPKKRKDAASATPIASYVGQFECHVEKTADRFHVIRTKMKTQLESTRMSTPKTLPIRNPCMTISSTKSTSQGVLLGRDGHHREALEGKRRAGPRARAGIFRSRRSGCGSGRAPRHRGRLYPSVAA